MIIIGDTHSIRPIFAAIDDNNIENQNIIHVGDVGIGFLSVKQDVANLQLLDRALIETNNKLYLIRGNHDFKNFGTMNSLNHLFLYLKILYL
jgi:predicted phosphodiesterase